MDRAFDVLRIRLLLEQLDRVTSADLHTLIIREAETAAALAGMAGFPTLLFPCTFEERIVFALAEEKRRRERYWQGLAGARSTIGVR